MLLTPKRKREFRLHLCLLSKTYWGWYVTSITAKRMKGEEIVDRITVWRWRNDLQRADSVEEAEASWQDTSYWIDNQVLHKHIHTHTQHTHTKPWKSAAHKQMYRLSPRVHAHIESRTDCRIKSVHMICIICGRKVSQIKWLTLDIVYICTYCTSPIRSHCLD